MHLTFKYTHLFTKTFTLIDIIIYVIDTNVKCLRPLCMHVLACKFVLTSAFTWQQFRILKSRN